MSRKNHHNGRHPQARRRTDGTRPTHTPARVPAVEAMIIPHGRCPRSGKLRFDEHEAKKALRQAQITRIARGQEAHMERRYYECKISEGGCGSWHLTSREEYVERGRE